MNALLIALVMGLIVNVLVVSAALGFGVWAWIQWSEKETKSARLEALIRHNLGGLTAPLQQIAFGLGEVKKKLKIAHTDLKQDHTALRDDIHTVEETQAECTATLVEASEARVAVMEEAIGQIVHTINALRPYSHDGSSTKDSLPMLRQGHPLDDVAPSEQDEDTGSSSSYGFAST